MSNKLTTETVLFVIPLVAQTKIKKKHGERLKTGICVRNYFSLDSIHSRYSFTRKDSIGLSNALLSRSKDLKSNIEIISPLGQFG